MSAELFSPYYHLFRRDRCRLSTRSSSGGGRGTDGAASHIKCPLYQLVCEGGDTWVTLEFGINMCIVVDVVYFPPNLNCKEKLEVFFV